MSLGYPDLAQQAERLFGCEPDALAGAYDLYRRLRREAPVLEAGSVVTVSTFALVEQCLADPATFSSVQSPTSSRVLNAAAVLPPAERGQFRGLVRFRAMMMAASDPPDHTFLRRLAHRAFTPANIERMRATVQSLTVELLDRVSGRDEIEVLGDLAYDLPLYVISDLLGVAVQDRAAIRDWSASFAVFLGNYAGIPDAYRALAQWRTYLARHIAEQRTAPATPLMAALLAAEEDGQRLSVPQLEAMLVNLMFGGHETTTNTIANAVMALSRQPEQYQILRDMARGDQALPAGAVDEVLRFATSVQTVHRVATRDCVLDGHQIKAGQTVRLLLGSANRDEAYFANPDVLDLRRSPRRILTFGRGPHFCIGAALARLEIGVALAELARRYERISPAAKVSMRPNFGLRGPRAVGLQVVRGGAT